MAGGTNNVKKRPGDTPGGPGAYQPGGQNVGGWTPPHMRNGGPGGTPPQWGQGGYPQPDPAQMEQWKKQFPNWDPSQGNPPPNWNPGQGQPGQYPPMNIPGLLGGGQPGQYPQAQNQVGFSGYPNSPQNWQDPNNQNGNYNS